MPVESDDPHRLGDTAALEIRMLGPLTLYRRGEALPLPASRKMRALFGYLALSPNAVTRSQLCELLWDVPNDPRGELRWCLSKIRSIVDEPDRQRVTTSGDTVGLDLSDCTIDTTRIAQAVQGGLATQPVERLRRFAALFNGEVLEDVDIDRSPSFNNWLVAQRRRFRACRTALLEQLVKTASDDEAFVYLDQWLELSPFDQRVHEILLKELARRGRLKEGEEHLAGMSRLFATEGLDDAALREIWQAAKVQGSAATLRVQSVPALEAETPGRPAESLIRTPRRASIAVMPFVDRGAAGAPAAGLAYDIITRLAKLRALFVIAQGTVFALHERGIGSEDAGRTLNVDYVVSGSVQQRDQRLTVSVELVETRTARIVWAEVFNQKLDDTFQVLDEIGNRIVASIASEIETIERNRAILRPPNSLDAWEAYHRGLWHMYRFSHSDNERAQHFFKTAIRLDPTFARAYAGLSFTHFQNAFQGWSKRGPEVERAYETAGQSLMADDRDPAAHWAMGRALWLRGEHDRSVSELGQALDLSPNFALAHYNLAFVHSTAGDSVSAISSADHSRDLSPFDPMLFGMLGARAMAHVRLGQYDQAADWGIKAAARPNAFAHIKAIAAYSLALAGRHDEARGYLAGIRKTLPHYGAKDLITAMQFDAAGSALFQKAGKLVDKK